MEQILSLDKNILDFIYNNLHNDFLDFFMPLITKLGDNGLFIIIVTAALFCFKKTRKTGFTVVLALVFVAVVGNLLLKPLIARERPYDVTPGIELLVEKLSDYSFPSGHTFSWFSFATVILFANKKYGIIAVIIAFLVAFSRLYLYVHYPTDVFAGMILGIIAAFISKLIIDKLYNRYCSLTDSNAADV